MINRVSYLYKADDNTLWTVSGYIDDWGRFIPVYATNYIYGIR